MIRKLMAVTLFISLMSIFALDVNAQWGMRGGRHNNSEEQPPSADDSPDHRIDKRLAPLIFGKILDGFTALAFGYRGSS